MLRDATEIGESGNFFEADSKASRDVIRRGGLVMLDFWSEQCGPCRSLMPLLQDLARQKPGLTIVKVEIEENDDLAEEFDVRSIPALLLFKEGERVDTLVGKSSYVMIERMVAKQLTCLVRRKGEGRVQCSPFFSARVLRGQSNRDNATFAAVVIVV